MWAFGSLQYLALIRRAARLSGVDTLDPVAYSLRHGGASDDCLSNRRHILAIKCRGRWRSDSSLRRYQKAAVAQKELSRLSADTLHFGRLVDRHLASLLNNKMAVPPPPRALRAAPARG